ncbi:DUF3742 family protein [Ralstonia mannitolilytica]|jgi:hypothetical protein|uniref:DUF3742 family protein n=1 Tax=Ralstonia mannitolilytica TaxID=105219 RepID=UPI0009595B8A|nr:DUF3742 family protein [Ralstonia mannitolilytica]OJW95829.1 MAG: DUF3742 domain-containing protein [Burkholderiales bacterium 66-26]PLT17045.1 DUF3742 domain-containing protein [Ralstonia mannitolilytica]
MKTAAQTTFAERLGRTLGRAWRGCARLDRRAQGWLRGQGLAPDLVQAASLVVKLAALGVLLYSAFWLALLIVGLVVVSWMAKQDHDEEDSDFLGRKAEEGDHRQGLFYHPASYDDDPDPRFKDD